MPCIWAFSDSRHKIGKRPSAALSSSFVTALSNESQRFHFSVFVLSPHA
jgi:hypothetical protein